MVRSFLLVGTILTILGSLPYNSYCMDYTNLPQDFWLEIIARCTPTSRNAVRKVCKLLAGIAGRDNIPKLIGSQASYDRVTGKCLLTLSSYDLEAAVQDAHLAGNQTTLELLKTHCYYNPKTSLENFTFDILRNGPQKRYNLLNNDGVTLLQFQCTLGYPPTVCDALKGNFTITEKQAAVRTAIQHGYFECARTILLKDPNIIKPSFLIDAIIADNAECVEFLLKKCSVSANQTICESTDYHQDPHLESLLHKTVRIKAIGIMQQLLQAGADTTQKDSDGHTPLDLARMLLAKESSENQKTSEHQKIVDILSKTQ